MVVRLSRSINVIDATVKSHTLFSPTAPLLSACTMHPESTAKPLRFRGTPASWHFCTIPLQPPQQYLHWLEKLVCCIPPIAHSLRISRANARWFHQETCFSTPVCNGATDIAEAGCCDWFRLCLFWTISRTTDDWRQMDFNVCLFTKGRFLENYFSSNRDTEIIAEKWSKVFEHIPGLTLLLLLLLLLMPILAADTTVIFPIWLHNYWER